MQSGHLRPGGSYSPARPMNGWTGATLVIVASCVVSATRSAHPFTAYSQWFTWPGGSITDSLGWTSSVGARRAWAGPVQTNTPLVYALVDINNQSIGQYVNNPARDVVQQRLRLCVR